MRTLKLKPLLLSIAIMAYGVFGLWIGHLWFPAPHPAAHFGLSLEGKELVWGFIFCCFSSAASLVFAFPLTKPHPKSLKWSLSKDPAGIAKAFGRYNTRMHYRAAYTLLLVGFIIMFVGLFSIAS